MWYKAIANRKLKTKFSSLNEGEKVYFRISEDQETITCRYTWQQIDFLKSEFLEYITPFLKEEPIENSGFVACEEAHSVSLEKMYEEIVKQKRALEKQEKKKIAEQELIATLDENQLVDFEIQ